MSTWLPALLVGITIGVVTRVWYRAWRRRRTAERRRVEAPNSHYSSQGVRNQEDRERWGRINRRKLHPLNRDEVERLLDVVDQEGIKAISRKDRLFLDNMTIPRLG
jgi:integrase